MDWGKASFSKFDMFSAILHSDSLIKVKEQFKYDCITEVINTDISGNSAVLSRNFWNLIIFWSH